jgi:hypothetical protein
MLNELWKTGMVICLFDGHSHINVQLDAIGKFMGTFICQLLIAI